MEAKKPNKKYRKNEANKIAKELFEEGILLGEELIDFIKATHIKFVDENDLIDFSDMVLDSIDKRSKYFKVTDLHTRKKYIFNSIKGASDALNVNDASLGYVLKKGTPLYGRFLMESCTWKMEDMKKGITYQEYTIKYEKENVRYGKTLDSKVKVIDTQTGISKVYRSGRKVCNQFNINHAHLYQYLTLGFKLNGRFIIQRGDCLC